MKLFGALAGVYSGMLLVNEKLGKDFVTEMLFLKDLLASHGFHLGGHTDTTHYNMVDEYLRSLKGGKKVDPIQKSACGAADNLPTGIRNVAAYGPHAAFTRLEKFLLGDYYDLNISERLIQAATLLTGTIPGKLDQWHGGNLITALADNPDHIEVLKDDGLGVHGHRGAKIVVVRKPGFTLDRRRVADKVEKDPLLARKKPNAFGLDAWTIPEIANPLAEYMATTTGQFDDYHRLIVGAIGHTQLGTGITLTKGTQGVIEVK